MEEADIVVAGGGTTGLIVACRLAKADPTLSIVVLESGIETRNNPLIVNPAMYIHNLFPPSKTAAFYKSRAREELGGRELVIVAGGCLGGGSSINLMVYSRAQMIDFDDWGADGWRGKDMLPFLRNYERFQDTNPGIDKSVHGYEGEISVSAGTYAQRPFQEDFLQACKQLGIPETVDVQDLRTSNAVGRWNKYIDQDTGLRQDVPHRMLYPILDAKDTGLRVLTESRVDRILFEGHKAVGVKYRHGTTDKEIRARRLVVLASGALGTPQILERSGIGGKELLDKLGIPLISDLPGVGTNYQDHNALTYPYKSSASAEETLDGIVSGRLGLEEALEKKNAAPRRHILGWNGFDCVGKLRPTDEEAESFPECLKTLWEKDFKPRAERPLLLMSSLAVYFGDHSNLGESQHFSLGPYTPYPYSRGSVHITDRNPLTPPEFDCGFFDNPADLEKLVWGYKKQREIARRMAHYRGPLQTGHPSFPAGSKAGFDAIDEASREQGHAVPITYSEEDNEAIRAFLRNNISTTWHSMGTCAMKPREERGVVDKDLDVYGVEQLKIAGKFSFF
ncbi:putative choline dehydrogenase [Paecilomyces variotii]|uniref:Putative choline dehydrogenase n=1 Tax=Byssochlamys spectabilis TaxID=264951 RepID=A0A443HZW8_BYSSP|nr:putative choline dehydrogenase [Paecilomyces variotii]RWQ97353.1 putative choline dehydrogenase [Paecilomyces variotii]